jgi:hypothetical protein
LTRLRSRALDTAHADEGGNRMGARTSAKRSKTSARKNKTVKTVKKAKAGAKKTTTRKAASTTKKKAAAKTSAKKATSRKTATTRTTAKARPTTTQRKPTPAGTGELVHTRIAGIAKRLLGPSTTAGGQSSSGGISHTNPARSAMLRRLLG